MWETCRLASKCGTRDEENRLEADCCKDGKSQRLAKTPFRSIYFQDALYSNTPLWEIVDNGGAGEGSEYGKWHLIAQTACSTESWLE